ncbi:3-deoxy-D-manno-octulosonic acid transferase [Pseudooceanicola sp. C21-150M6]|uniref:3-deoxy-D-manno-octulosonic acid transferase n=1 Tax=Pseudooceanicola sp. C21-150M6 TaxID=3434355 RepID=UPI003D7F1A3F
MQALTRWSSQATGEGARNWPPRPDGPVVWGHTPDPDQIPALLQLASRIGINRPEVSMVLTTPGPLQPLSDLTTRVSPVQLPEDSTSASKAFLAHWRPNLCIWHTGHLRPVLLGQAIRSGIPLVLVDMKEDALPETRLRWRSRNDRGLLASPEKIFANSGNAARKLARLGANPDHIEVTGPLQQGGTALPCDEETRAELSEILATRPVWLATRIRLDELDQIVEAHRQAIRASHRIFLILVPADPADAPEMDRILTRTGLRHVRWSQGQQPDELTQVLLAENRCDMGLWYRLAPVAFMGSSLAPGHGGTDPYEAASLGSAILYGPHVENHATKYEKFARAGAARLVRDAAALSATVIRLTAVDQAAVMAQAAWDVATEGAHVTDQVVETVEDILDRVPPRANA